MDSLSDASEFFSPDSSLPSVLLLSSASEVCLFSASTFSPSSVTSPTPSSSTWALSLAASFASFFSHAGRNVHILKPKKVAVAYRDYLKNISRDYKGIDK